MYNCIIIYVLWCGSQNTLSHLESPWVTICDQLCEYLIDMFIRPCYMSHSILFYTSYTGILQWVRIITEVKKLQYILLKAWVVHAIVYVYRKILCENEGNTLVINISFRYDVCWYEALCLSKKTSNWHLAIFKLLLHFLSITVLNFH